MSLSLYKLVGHNHSTCWLPDQSLESTVYINPSQEKEEGVRVPSLGGGKELTLSYVGRNVN